MQSATGGRTIGAWQVQVRRSGSHNVSRTFHKKADARAHKKADARAWAQQMEAQADRHDLPKNMGKELKSLTVRNLIERYRDAVVVKKHCQNPVGTSLTRFLNKDEYDKKRGKNLEAL